MFDLTIQRLETDNGKNKCILSFVLQSKFLLAHILY